MREPDQDDPGAGIGDGDTAGGSLDSGMHGGRQDGGMDSGERDTVAGDDDPGNEQGGRLMDEEDEEGGGPLAVEALAVGELSAEDQPLDEALPGEEDQVGDEVPARLCSIVESLLFAADRPLSVKQLRQVLGERDPRPVRAALRAVRGALLGRGFQLFEVAGGYQLRTDPGNASWVHRMLKTRPARLSRAALETLAIVAYKQPITRPEVEEIRGVDSGSVLKALLDRNLIRILGRKEEPGRPILYGTTREFLVYFSLRDLRDLPTLREVRELSPEAAAEVENLGESDEGVVEGSCPRPVDGQRELEDEAAALAELGDAVDLARDLEREAAREARAARARAAELEAQAAAAAAAAWSAQAAAQSPPATPGEEEATAAATQRSGRAARGQRFRHVAELEAELQALGLDEGDEESAAEED